MRARTAAFVSLCLGLVVTGRIHTTGSVQTVRAQEREQGSGAGEIEILPVQGNVYMLAGAGANITIQVDDAGLVIVDTGRAMSSARVIDAIRKFSAKPVRYIINTQSYEDHTGGNGAISDAFKHPPIIAHENLVKQLTDAGRPSADLPTDSFFTPIRDLYNGEVIQIFYQPAEDDGDSIVHFRRSDVVSAGDVFLTTTYPFIDVAAGGHINKILEGLNHILDITVPIDKEENGTLVVPGHGRICDEADVVEYRDMLTILRDRVQDAVASGVPLAKFKASKPTMDFDGRYGISSGPWTTEMFIDAMYANLSASKPKPAEKAPAGRRK